MNTGLDVTLGVAGLRLADGLRLYLGTGRRLSVIAFADAIGTSESSVRNWLSGDATPSMDVLFRMMAILPDAFTIHLLEMNGREWARVAA